MPSFNPNIRVWDNVSANELSDEPNKRKSSISLQKGRRLISSNAKDIGTLVYNNLTIDSSFSSVLSNKTIGGKMLTDLVFHLHKENVYNIPLFYHLYVLRPLRT